MRQKTVQLFLFLFLSVFICNQLADYVSFHKVDTSSYVCEMNEVEELNEIGSRLRSFNSTDLVIVSFHFDFINDMFAEAETSVSSLSGSSAFFPNALHVPIYLGKCVFLI